MLDNMRIQPGQVGNLWVSIGRQPTEKEIRDNAAFYDTVILNAWDTNQAKLIKQLNPRAIVLVYKCLSSTRSYTTSQLVPAGIRYQDAKPEWFALDNAGRRIEWTPYPGHWQMATWHPDYQKAWADNVLRELKQSGFDGVFADNDIQALRWYSQTLVQGTRDSNSSDAKIRGGLDQLVKVVGSELNKANKLFVVNYSDGRLNLDRWKSHTQYGGGMDEHFVHWGTDANAGYVTDWGKTGWIDQTALLNTQLTLVTTAAGTDIKPLRYGYASVLVRAGGRVVWQPHQVENYSKPERFNWQSINIGKPTTNAYVVKQIWRRRFENVFVAVNPTDTDYKLTTPKDFKSKKVVVPAKDAIVVDKSGRLL